MELRRALRSLAVPATPAPRVEDVAPETPDEAAPEDDPVDTIGNGVAYVYHDPKWFSPARP